MDTLSSDILDDDIVKAFQAVHCVIYWLGFHRVSIKHKYVTAPSVYYQFYSSALSVCNILYGAYFAFNCESCLEATSSVFIFKLGAFSIVTMNAIIAGRNVFCNGNSNSQLYVKLQKIDRILKMRGSTKANRQIFWFSVLAILVYLMTWVVSFVLLNIVAMKSLCPALLFIHITGAGGFAEMILVSCILFFLIQRLELVIAILEREAVHLKNKSLEANVSFLWTEINIKDLDKVTIGVYYILEVFADLLTLFQFSVLLFLCQVMIWDFTVMQSLVTAIKSKKVQPSDIHFIAISEGTFLAIFIAMTILSALANRTTSKMNQTRKLLFNVLSLTSENQDEVQKKTQHVIMLLDNKPKFNIYDIFTVDNRLPLHILAITASYTMVVLQFATIN